MPQTKTGGPLRARPFVVLSDRKAYGLTEAVSILKPGPMVELSAMRLM